jgi:tetratricopeptide (TPR) repeat protein
MLSSKEIMLSYENIIRLLDQKSLKKAFGLLSAFIEQCRSYTMHDHLEKMENTNRQMLIYRMDGVKDPMQNSIYVNLIMSAYELADHLKLMGQVNDVTSFWGQQIRQLNALPETNVADLCQQIISCDDIDNRRDMESMLPLLFNHIWLKELKEDDDANALLDMLIDNSESLQSARCIAVSALTLGLMQTFNLKKLLLLFDACYRTADEQVYVRSLIGIVIALHIYRGRIWLYPQINARLTLLAEHPDFPEKLLEITLRFILAQETESITKRLKDEIMPAMMEIVPEALKKMGNNAFNAEAMEMNPDWEDFFENSSAARSIEEYNHLQEEGADIMLSSFIHLKNFPFFREISNWFMPFDASNSIFEDSVWNEIGKDFLHFVSVIPNMCDSDKYSFCFSIMQMPPAQRNFFTNNMSGQAMEMAGDFIADSKSAGSSFPVTAGKYIQDLYRFFKISPQHGFFNDIFSWPIDFYNLEPLKPYLSDTDNLKSIGEYYMRRNKFDNAVELLSEVALRDGSDDMVWQKTGYCKQMLGDTKGALDAYLRADVIESGNKWLAKRIAGCYRTLGQPTEALEYYRRIEEMNPDDLSAQLNIGHCYLETDRYEEALKQFFKVEYLSPDNNKAKRPIAWTSFLVGKYEQAANYYRSILSESDPTLHDYLNAGHVAWALNDMKKAVRFYMEALERCDDRDFNIFQHEFDSDVPQLINAGIDPQSIPLMLDQIQYENI